MPRNSRKLLGEILCHHMVQGINKELRVGYVYRNRFKSVPIMNREQLYTCIKYIHMNPVKTKIVEKESNYKYSSYNDYLNKTGFIHEKILKFIFSSTDNYIEKFQLIKYKNLEKGNNNLKEALESFLRKENIEFRQILKGRNYIKKFICYLISNNYEFMKKRHNSTFGDK